MNTETIADYAPLKRGLYHAVVMASAFWLGFLAVVL
jgi:hypothetical protein